MSYITPDTIVHLLKGCPIDKDYTHTLYFKNETEQYNYFVGLKKHTLNNQTYQRWDKGSIRVNLLVDKVYDCNYMMFRNTTFGNKWFYAFIDSVEYVNNVTCTINYTIDVMQTWYFDYETGQCFIERQHTETDYLGEHIIEENINTGELIIQDEINDTWSPYRSGIGGYDFSLIIIYVPNKQDLFWVGTTGKIFITIDDNGEITSTNINDDNKFAVLGELLNGVFMGCNFAYVTMNELAQFKINKLVSEMVKADNNIIAMYQVPTELLTVAQSGYKPFNEHNVVKERTIEPHYYFKSINFLNTSDEKWYTPKNKKLFSYPYFYINATNNNGDYKIYRFENFFRENITDTYKAYFKIQGCVIPTPELSLFSTKYRGVNNTYDNDYNNNIPITHFSHNLWSEDSFTRWYNTNGTSFLANSVSNLGVSLGRSDFVSGATGVLSDVSGLMDRMNTPDIVKGDSTTNVLQIAQSRFGYTYYIMGVKVEYAKIIDDYFTKFGYQLNIVDTPNIKKSNAKLRPHFNYIKTNGCIIHPATGKGLPSEDEKLISQIYDKGITFWMNGNEVGDYSLDNSPVQGDE